MPFYTYLLYNLNPQNDQKHTNNSQNVINLSKCVLYVIQVQKRLKTSEKHASSHKCQFQSLEFHKVSKLVHGYSKYGKLPPKVILKS